MSKKSERRRLDESEVETAVFRWAAFVSMAGVCTILLVFFVTFETGEQLEFLEVEIQGPKPPSDDNPPLNSIPPIIIWESGVVEFEGMQWPAEDNRLQSLRKRLRVLAPRIGPGNPIVIQPSDDVRHERLIHVVSTLTGSGILDYEVF